MLTAEKKGPRLGGGGAQFARSRMGEREEPKPRILRQAQDEAFDKLRMRRSRDSGGGPTFPLVLSLSKDDKRGTNTSRSRYFHPARSMTFSASALFWAKAPAFS